MQENMLAAGILIISLCIGGIYTTGLEVVNQWNLLDFDFPYDYSFINNYRPERTFFTGVEVTDDRIFLSMPRIFAGVPATLASIPRHLPPGTSPKLQAYPDWSYHQAGRGGNFSCDGLVSVYRIKADSCNRLWVVDSGVMTSLEDFLRVCPPKIAIIDLATDRVVRTIIFPREVLRPSSLLTNLVIDESIQGPCDSAFVYLTDTVTPGIVVYDALTDRTWRWMHPTMFADPDFADATIDGETFTLMDGIVGISHSPNTGTVFYQPFATDRIFSVATAALRRPPADLEVLPVTLVGRKASQGVGLAVDEQDDTLFFGPVRETSLASFNTHTNQQDLVAFDRQRLQFLAEIRWSKRDGGCVWMLASRFQKFFLRTINPREINLRILRICPNSRPYLANAINNSVYFKKK